MPGVIGSGFALAKHWGTTAVSANLEPVEWSTYGTHAQTSSAGTVAARGEPDLPCPLGLASVVPTRLLRNAR